MVCGRSTPILYCNLKSLEWESLVMPELHMGADQPLHFTVTKCLFTLDPLLVPSTCFSLLSLFTLSEANLVPTGSLHLTCNLRPEHRAPAYCFSKEH